MGAVLGGVNVVLGIFLENKSHVRAFLWPIEVAVGQR